MSVIEEIEEIKAELAEIETVESRKRTAKGGGNEESEWRASFGLPDTPTDSRTRKASDDAKADRGGGWTGVFGFDGERE